MARKTTAWLHNGRRKYVIELTGQSTKAGKRVEGIPADAGHGGIVVEMWWRKGRKNPIRLSQFSRRRERLACRVDGRKIWFNSKDVELSGTDEALVSMFLLPAACAGRPLQVEGRLDDQFVLGIRSLLEVAEEWWHYHRVGVQDDRGDVSMRLFETDRTLLPQRSPRAALYFSGGVDSFYSLFQHREELSALVFLRGFDLRLRDRTKESLDGAERSVRDVCDQLNLQPIVVETNLRGHPLMKMPPWGVAHGGALAGIGHLMGDRFGSFLISASYPASWEGAKYGTHRFIDPLWSSSRLDFRHVGDECSREEKFRQIAQQALVQKHLRVCGKSPTPDVNCGRCEKCLRTRLILAKHHPGLRIQTLPTDHSLLEDLGRLEKKINRDLCRVYRQLAAPPMQKPVAEAIYALINRSMPDAES